MSVPALEASLPLRKTSSSSLRDTKTKQVICRVRTTPNKASRRDEETPSWSVIEESLKTTHPSRLGDMKSECDNVLSVDTVTAGVQ